MSFGIIAWIVVGIIAGFIASKNVNLDPRLGIGSGVIGAVSGGTLYSVLSGAVAGFSLWSVFFAALGAAGVLLAWHFMMTWRSAWRA